MPHDGSDKSFPPKPVIGWCEYVDLPEWGIRRLKAKVDTGARTSSLHVEHLVDLDEGHVEFNVVLDRKSKRVVRVIAEVSREARVRSSLGRSSSRPFVKAVVRLGSVEQEVEVNLVDRGDLLHRMLLGRTALRPFQVDVARRYAQGRPVRPKLKKRPTTKKASDRAAHRKAGTP